MLEMANKSDKPYLKLVNVNTSKYFEQCWMKVDPTTTSEIMNSTDPSYAYSEGDALLQTILLMPLSFIGTILNILVIWVIVRCPELRSEYLSFSILSSSLTDLLWGLSITPITSLIGLLKDMPAPCGCEFYGFLTYLLWETSALNLVGIAILRLVGVWYPRKVQSGAFHYASRIVPITCWFLSLLTILPIVSKKIGRFGLECKKFVCIIVDVDSDMNQLSLHPLKIIMRIIIFAGLLSIVLSIITVIKVSTEMRKVNKVTNEINQGLVKRNLEREKKLGGMVIGITVSFILVYCPFIGLLLIDPNAGITKPTMYIFATFFQNSLIVIDPIIYVISQEKYRKSIRELIVCKSVTSMFINSSTTE